MKVGGGQFGLVESDDGDGMPAEFDHRALRGIVGVVEDGLEADFRRRMLSPGFPAIALAWAVPKPVMSFDPVSSRASTLAFSL